MSNTQCLVVVDYQKDFVDGVLGCGQPALDIESFIEKKIQEHLDARHTVFFTLDTHTEPVYSDSVESSSYTLHCRKYTEGWLPYGVIKNYMTQPGVEAIEKATYGCAELASRISASPIRDVEIVGVYTDVCVFHNAVLIYNTVPEANIRVFASGCASPDAAMHSQSLRMMRTFVTVVE